MATKFKVKVGTHIDVDRKYVAGETLISDQNLDTMFPGKFENLGVVPLRNPVLPSPPSTPSGEDVVKDEEDTIKPIKKKEPPKVVVQETPPEARRDRRPPA